jgi:sterol desaturase/sphingolipid hydroxylase (fatty acid hydroxylase superfamily)
MPPNFEGAKPFTEAVMKLSIFSYYLDFVLAPFLMALLAAQMSLRQWPSEAAAIILGFALWTLAEYLVHRFLYHHISFFHRFHDAHHALPNERIGGPPLLAIVLIFALVALPMMSLEWAIGAGATFGCLAGYLAYMVVHDRAHLGARPVNALFNRLRSHHLRHHFLDGDGNYGVTTVFWDYVFGTVIRPRFIRSFGAKPADLG